MLPFSGSNRNRPRHALVPSVRIAAAVLLAGIFSLPQADAGAAGTATLRMDPNSYGRTPGWRIVGPAAWNPGNAVLQNLDPGLVEVEFNMVEAIGPYLSPRLVTLNNDTTTSLVAEYRTATETLSVGRPSLTAPTIDGVLESTEWPGAGKQLQFVDGSGTPGPTGTLHVVANSDAIYVGVEVTFPPAATETRVALALDNTEGWSWTTRSSAPFGALVISQAAPGASPDHTFVRSTDYEAAGSIDTGSGVVSASAGSAGTYTFEFKIDVPTLIHVPGLTSFSVLTGSGAATPLFTHGWPAHLAPGVVPPDLATASIPSPFPSMNTTQYGSAFLLGTDWNMPGAGVIGSVALGGRVFGTNDGQSLHLAVRSGWQGDIRSGAGLYGQFTGPVTTISSATTRVYRLRTTVISTNPETSDSDPAVILGLRSNSYSSSTSSPGGEFSALAGRTRKTFTTYLVLEPGQPLLQNEFILFTNNPSQSGGLQVRDIRIDSFPLAALTNPTTVYDAGAGAPAGFEVSATGDNGTWRIPSYANGEILEIPSGATPANFTVAPQQAGETDFLSIQPDSGPTTSTQAIATWGARNLYTTRANRLVMVTAQVQTANPAATRCPYLWITAAGAAPSHLLSHLLVIPNGDPPTPQFAANPGSPYRLLYDSYGDGVQASLSFRAFGSVYGARTLPRLDGDLTLTRLTVEEYDPPSCPCP